MSINTIPRTISIPSVFGYDRPIAQIEIIGGLTTPIELVLVHFIDGHTLRIKGEVLSVEMQER